MATLGDPCITWDLDIRDGFAHFDVSDEPTNPRESQLVNAFADRDRKEIKVLGRRLRVVLDNRLEVLGMEMRALTLLRDGFEEFEDLSQYELVTTKSCALCAPPRHVRVHELSCVDDHFTLLLAGLKTLLYPEASYWKVPEEEQLTWLRKHLQIETRCTEREENNDPNDA